MAQSQPALGVHQTADTANRYRPATTAFMGSKATPYPATCLYQQANKMAVFVCRYTNTATCMHARQPGQRRFTLRASAIGGQEVFQS